MTPRIDEIECLNRGLHHCAQPAASSNKIPRYYKDVTCSILLASITSRESLGANRVCKLGMLVEPRFVRKHRLHCRRDESTRRRFDAGSVNIFFNAMCGHWLSRFTFPEAAKFFNQKLQRTALLRTALITKRIACLYQHVPIASEPALSVHQTELLRRHGLR